MDSDFRHNGVGLMHRNRLPGGWFFGEVRVVRWKDTSWQLPNISSSAWAGRS
jgi:hypothetical protein